MPNIKTKLEEIGERFDEKFTDDMDIDLNPFLRANGINRVGGNIIKPSSKVKDFYRQAFLELLEGELKEVVKELEGMKKEDFITGDCPECKGFGHLGHDRSDNRPEHINDGDCQTCPVKCHACFGSGKIEFPDETKMSYNQALTDTLSRIKARLEH